MKLSIIAPDITDACGIYRATPWTKLGIETERYSGKVGFQLHEAVINADAVLLQRPWSTAHIGIAKTIKDCGKKLIIDFDDDYSCLPQWNPNAHFFEGCLPQLKILCSLADAVTVATPALVIAATSWGAERVTLVKNAIDDGLRNLVKKPRNPIVLWRGSNTHSADLEEGREYFAKMNATHEVVFFGDKPPWAYTLKHRFFGVTDYANMLTTIATLAPEFLAVPLVDCAFNIAKSDIAAQEAFLVGAKLWHNNVGEFKQHPVDETGSVRWLSSVQHLRHGVLNSL